MAFPLLMCYNAGNELEEEVSAVAIESGAWIMRGLRWDDPCRIRSWQELIRWIDEVGFLPLFKNEIDGFSAEEHTSDLYWWSGDPEQDPGSGGSSLPAAARQPMASFSTRKRDLSPGLVPPFCELAAGRL